MAVCFWGRLPIDGETPCETCWQPARSRLQSRPGRFSRRLLRKPGGTDTSASIGHTCTCTGPTHSTGLSTGRSYSIGPSTGRSHSIGLSSARSHFIGLSTGPTRSTGHSTGRMRSTGLSTGTTRSTVLIGPTRLSGLAGRTGSAGGIAGGETAQPELSRDWRSRHRLSNAG